MNIQQYIIKDTPYERTTTVDGEIVTRKHVTEHKTGKCYLTWRFDFTDVTHDQLLELASRAVLIGERPRFKSCVADHIPEWDDKTFDVSTFVSRERVKKSPLATVMDNVGKLTDDERLALIAQLEG